MEKGRKKIKTSKERQRQRELKRGGALKARGANVKGKENKSTPKTENINGKG